MMRTAMILAALSFSSASALTLGEALSKTDLQGNVKLAKAEWSDAKINLDRQLADPLLIKPTEVQARQRFELAQAKLSAAQRSANSSIVSSFTQALAAQKQIQLVKKSVEISEISLKISDIRQKNGSGTLLDVRDAQRSLDDAQKNLAAAQDGFNLALRSLKNLVGEFDNTLVASKDLPDLPAEKMIDTVLARSVNALQVRQGLDLLKVQRSVQDPSYVAQSQIDATDKQIADTEQNLSDLLDGERVQVRSLFNAAVSAYKGIAVSDKAENNAQDKLQNDQKRFKGGLISQVQLVQTELGTIQAELALLQAKNSYLTSYYAFLSGSGGR